MSYYICGTDVLGADIQALKVGSRVSFTSFSGKRAVGTVEKLNTSGDDGVWIRLDDGSGEDHMSAELTLLRAAAPAPKKGAAKYVSSQDEAALIARQKALFATKPAEYKAQVEFALDNFGATPILIASITDAVSVDPAFAKVNIDLINADPKLSKQFQALLAANPQEASALRSALAKAGLADVLDHKMSGGFFQRKYAGVPTWGWGLGLGALASAAAFAVWRKTR